MTDFLFSIGLLHVHADNMDYPAWQRYLENDGEEEREEDSEGRSSEDPGNSSPACTSTTKKTRAERIVRENVRPEIE